MSGGWIHKRPSEKPTPNVRVNADRGGRQRKAGLRECTPYLRPALRCLPERVGVERGVRLHSHSGDSLPNLKLAVLGGVDKVVVRREQCELVSDAELRKQRVDGAELNASSAAGVAQLCRGDVILTVGVHPSEGSESFDDLLFGGRSSEALEEFLEDQACCDHERFAEQSISQRLNLWFGSLYVPAKPQRPDAGIDEQTHDRLRSALYS